LDSNSILYLRSGQAKLLTAIGGPMISGGGTFVMSSSSLTANVYASLIESATLVLGGKTQLDLLSHWSNFTLNSSLIQFTTGESGEQPYVSIQPLGPFCLLGNWNIPGELVALGPVLLNGSISFTGGFSATSYNNVISSSLTCGGPVVLNGQEGNACELVASNALITAPYVQVNQNCAINPVTLVTINGDVINNGTIYASEGNHIVVKGNYTQSPSGALVAYGLSPASGNINLEVSGNTSLAGTLQYNVSNQPKEETKYVIVSSNSSIIGKFSTQSVSGNDAETKKLGFQIEYSQSSFNQSQISITLTPAKSSPSYAGLKWYYWVAIGGGALVAVIAVVVIVWRIRIKRRAQYAPVK